MVIDCKNNFAIFIFCPYGIVLENLELILQDESQRIWLI